MRYLLFILSTIISVIAFSQTRLYTNENFDAIAKGHEVIAILPFKTAVSLRPKQMKDITPDQLRNMEEDEASLIQSSMYSWFLKRDQQGTLSVDVQDIAVTNARLQKEGITLDNLAEYTPTELAEILEVDAIVKGLYKTNKPMSEGASVALGLLIGFYGATNEATMNFYIYDKGGEILINYNKRIAGSVGSSSEGLINVLMRKISRRMAYTN